MSDIVKAIAEAIQAAADDKANENVIQLDDMSEYFSLGGIYADDAEELAKVAAAAVSARISVLEELIRQAIPVVAYVSAGRGYIGVEPYPDAAARRVLAELQDALDGVEEGER